MVSSIPFINNYFSSTQQTELTQLIKEPYNSDYEAHQFTLGAQSYRSRLAKLTPKKKGYFVAFWEKNSQNQNQAFSLEQHPDYLIIAIMDQEKKGLFIFPKDILAVQGILRTDTQKGKMAIRVYPSWEADLNQTATKTQTWQCQYFVDLSS